MVVATPSSRTDPGVGDTRLASSRTAVSHSRSPSTSCSMLWESSTSSAGRIVMTTSLSTGRTFAVAEHLNTCETPGPTIPKQAFPQSARLPVLTERTCRVATLGGGWRRGIRLHLGDALQPQVVCHRLQPEHSDAQGLQHHRGWKHPALCGRY